MKCPNCGSENCQFIATTETHGKSFSFSNACCGSILLGPIGILCGACGTGVHSKTHEYWIHVESVLINMKQERAWKLTRIE